MIRPPTGRLHATGIRVALRQDLAGEAQRSAPSPRIISQIHRFSSLPIRVEGLGTKVAGIGIGEQGLGIRVCGLGLRERGSVIRHEGLWSCVRGIGGRVWILVFRGRACRGTGHCEEQVVGGSYILEGFN